MKLWEWERIVDQRLRDVVSISDGQFGFKPGLGTTAAILFVIRNLCEKYRKDNKPLDMVFVNGDTCRIGISRRCTHNLLVQDIHTPVTPEARYHCGACTV